MQYSTKNYLIIFIFFAWACNKDNLVPPQNTGVNLPVRINYFVDDDALQFDTLRYKNAAGNQYSVTRLNYYISNISLTTINNTVVHLNSYFFVDARNQPNILRLTNVPKDMYTAIKFDIGLSPDLNKHNQLETTDENISMLWPDVMGGGFHFLKIEGQYQTPTSGIQGYAMHVGLNYFLIKHQTIATNFTVASLNTDTIKLAMNINEWYKNPYTYNFYTDANYTMGDTSTMLLLTNNGKDVFYAK